MVGMAPPGVRPASPIGRYAARYTAQGTAGLPSRCAARPRARRQPPTIPLYPRCIRAARWRATIVTPVRRGLVPPGPAEPTCPPSCGAPARYVHHYGRFTSAGLPGRPPKLASRATESQISNPRPPDISGQCGAPGRSADSQRMSALRPQDYRPNPASRTAHAGSGPHRANQAPTR